jgi:hypothetical protein
MNTRKNILVTMLIFTLLAASFTAGTLISKPSYATITSEGNWSVPGDYVEGGLEEYTFTVTQSGEYLFQLTGEQGGTGYVTGYRHSTNTIGALGGSTSAVAQLQTGDIITIGTAPGSAGGYKVQSGSSYNTYYYGGKGGNSIYLEVNGTMYLGAGGGGGGSAAGNIGQMQPANVQNNGIFGPGTGGDVVYVDGESGGNYFNTSVLTNMTEPNIARNAGFKITLISNTGTLSRGDQITTTHAISTKDSNGDDGFIFAGTISKGTTIKESGFYIIECSGQAHGYKQEYTPCNPNYAGRITARAYLEAGDYIEGIMVPGGSSLWGLAGYGGTASLVTVNGIPLVGAGGAGGPGYNYYINSNGSSRGSFAAGGSVTTINNASFGSGGGGGWSRWVTGSTSYTLNLPGSIGSGGVMGAPGPAGGGGAGTNLLDTNLATLISQPNDGRDAYYIVKMEGARDYIPKIPFGKYKQMPALAIVDDTTLSDGTCETFTAQLPYALYEIILKGGQWGGQLVGSMMLKQGDKLHFSQILTYMSGGNGGNLGGNGILVYYDDAFSTTPEVLIAGVGGGTKNANDTGVGQAGGNKTIYYNYGEFTEMTGTVGSSIFGSGGSSTTQAPGNPGADGLINDLYGNGASPGEGAANFVDTGYLTSYTSSPNSGVTIPTGNFSIRLVSLGTPDQIAAIETLKNIADLQKRLTVLEAPIVTCQDGVPFETRVHTYSHITHTAIAVDGIQVLNEDLEDGYIVVKGSVNGVGYHDIFIHGLKFTFNVLESPNSSNVNVLLE